MKTLNFLFWNIQKKDLTEQIYNLCLSKNIDILVLAESTIDSNKLLGRLNTKTVEYFPNNPLSQCDKVTILTKFHHNYIYPVLETNRITIRRISMPLVEDFLLAGVHLVDKRSHSETSQYGETIVAATNIKRIETELNIEKTIIVGDFNMNPFETGMVEALGFHSTMSSNIALNRTRLVQGNIYRYFYNPMWSFYSDFNKASSGSHYYNKSDHLNYQWHLFDQVIMRPELIANFNKKTLEILESDGINSLLKNNFRPDDDLYSDHLPLFFSFSF